jgi:hypothetical protein
MAVLVPPVHTIGTCLSKSEYSFLEKFCIESGALSISDLASAAISNLITQATRNDSPSAAQGVSAANFQVLEERVAALSRAIVLLSVALPAASAPLRKGAQLIGRMRVSHTAVTYGFTPRVLRYGSIFTLKAKERMYAMGWTPRLRQPNKTLFAVRCKIVDRQDHCTAF